MFPIIYTPTEASAIANYSHLFRRSEGLYLHPTGIDTMEDDFVDACEGRDLDLVSWQNIDYDQTTELIADRRFRCRGNSRDWRSGRFGAVQSPLTFWDQEVLVSRPRKP